MVISNMKGSKAYLYIFLGKELPPNTQPNPSNKLTTADSPSNPITNLKVNKPRTKRKKQTKKPNPPGQKTLSQFGFTRNNLPVPRLLLREKNYEPLKSDCSRTWVSSTP
jgi:hypothetical protein